MKTAYMYLDLREKPYFKNLLVIEMLLSQGGLQIPGQSGLCIETLASRGCFNPPYGSAYNPWGQEEFKVSVSYLKPAQKQNCWVCWHTPVIPVLGKLK